MADTTLEQTMEEMRPRLLRYTTVAIEDRDDAEDLLQDAFLSVWRNIEDLRERVESPRGYLFRMVSNRIANHYRDQARAAEQDETISWPEDEDGDPVEFPDTRRHTPEEAYFSQIEAQELIEKLERAFGVDELPEEYREIIEHEMVPPSE